MVYAPIALVALASKKSNTSASQRTLCVRVKKVLCNNINIRQVIYTYNKTVRKLKSVHEIFFKNNDCRVLYTGYRTRNKGF